MKLKNKKTGEMIEGKCFTDIVKKLHERGDALCYGSLLNVDLFAEYWEEIDSYEPLIKDKRIRKIIRVWAEENDSTRVVYYSPKNALADSYGNSISFNLIFKELNHGAEYTIAELCGDSEEDEDEA